MLTDDSHGQMRKQVLKGLDGKDRTAYRLALIVNGVVFSSLAMLAIIVFSLADVDSPNTEALAIANAAHATQPSNNASPQK